MAAEWTAIGAAVLLAAGIGLQVAAWLRMGPDAGRWRRPVAAALGVRAAAAAALIAAAVLCALEEGGWSDVSVRQAAIDLAAAVLWVDLILVARMRLNAAGPAVDLAAIGLILCGLLALPGSATGSTPSLLELIQAFLTLLGAGAIAVAGSTALLLALRAVLIRRGLSAAWQSEGRLAQRSELHRFLYEAAVLGTLALGAGLTAGLWSAWRTSGSPASGDPRQAWIVSAALLAAAGLWAVRLGRQSGRWTALLAIAAAGLALTGLLAGIDLHQVLTF